MSCKVNLAEMMGSRTELLSSLLKVYLCLDEMGSNFQISVHLMDVEGKPGETRTPHQKQAAFLLLVYRKSPLSRCDSNSKTYFMVPSREEAVCWKFQGPV
ncbi:hypothetical protein AV530_019566 [Patagioenas fasciata monilis]|uniref:Uncharacterized protein n=1 Tax=Patagioenas fasciata monilis TaxID=372326 RepID=A0A1V4JE19_PATFA|nr:hypothetical protein AV530_019566 [Patagioenas fasciata monilis]